MLAFTRGEGKKKLIGHFGVAGSPQGDHRRQSLDNMMQLVESLLLKEEEVK
jgi:hypothetical protein